MAKNTPPTAGDHAEDLLNPLMRNAKMRAAIRPDSPIQNTEMDTRERAVYLRACTAYLEKLEEGSAGVAKNDAQYTNLIEKITTLIGLLTAPAAPFSLKDTITETLPEKIRYRAWMEVQGLPMSGTSSLTSMHKPHTQIFRGANSLIAKDLLMALAWMRSAGKLPRDEALQVATNAAHMLSRHLKEVIKVDSGIAEIDGVDTTEMIRDQVREQIKNVVDILWVESVSGARHWQHPMRDKKGKYTQTEAIPYGDVLVEILMQLWQNAKLKTRSRDTIQPDSNPERQNEGLNFTTKSLTIAEINQATARIVFSRESLAADVGHSHTIARLQKRSFVPHHKITIGTQVVYLSADTCYDIEQDDKDRIYTVIYLEDGDNLVARGCYRSLSSGVWRVMPAHTETWYHKGFGEQDTAVCPELLKSLARLGKPKKSRGAESVIKSLTKKSFALPHTYTRNITEYPVTLGTEFGKPIRMFAPPAGRKVQPDGELSFAYFDAEDYPNFSESVDMWIETIPMYGVTTYEVVASKNGKFRYLFARDEHGRVWIPTIDVTFSPISPSGVKSNWVDSGDMSTPAFEYRQQARGFGNEALQEKNYVDMSKNYLSKMKIVQEYMNSRGFKHKL